MLKLHFLNVGKGSCSIVEFSSGRLGMIDVDDSRTFSLEDLEPIAEIAGVKDQFQDLSRKGLRLEARRLVEKAYRIPLTDPIKYMTDNFPGRSIFRFVLTHPDMDHMSGLARLQESVGFMNLWDTTNNKSIPVESWSTSPYRKEDWDTYQSIRGSTESPKSLCLQRNDSGSYWTEDNVRILSPCQDLADLACSTEEYNHISYVLHISHSGGSVICAGDASLEAQQDILNQCADKDLKADVLLAPHHGSKSHFCHEFVEAISPTWIIVSVAVGGAYAYNEYSRFGQVLSTKWRGNIIMSIDDSGEISCSTQFHQP